MRHGWLPWTIRSLLRQQWRLCYPPSLDESASLEAAVTSPVNELWKWLVSSSLGEGKHEHIGPSNKITLISIHQKTVKLDSQILRIERTGVSKGYKSRQCVLYSDLLILDNAAPKWLELKEELRKNYVQKSKKKHCQRHNEPVGWVLLTK